MSKMISIARSIAFLLALFDLVRSDYLGRLCGTQFGSGDHDHFYPDGGSAVRQCIAYCHQYNRRYAALLFGHECFCDDTLYQYHVCSDDDTSEICTSGSCQLSTGMKCSADGTMICGDTTWYSLYDAKEDHNVITRWSTIVNEVCSLDDPTCDWYCYVSDKEYQYVTGKVYGTDLYDIKSSYCLAAAHSLRYQANQKTEVIIARASQPSGIILEGSWRYGIASQWTKSFSTFTVKTPSENYDFGNSVLYGYVDFGSRTLDCTSYGSSVDVFAATLDNKIQATYSSLPLSDENEFFCGLRTSTGSRYPATYVPVISQPKGNEGVAQNRTVTINEGEELKFAFYTGGLSNGPFSVFKQNDQIVAPSSEQLITVQRSNAQTYFSGFYQLLNSRSEWQGSVRAIVVSKSEDLDQCSGFRGFPREDGTCLCIPPFGGDSKCSQVCKRTILDGSFGPDCTMNCGGTNQCKGRLICSEDSFGCHCASGWTGDDCNTECPEGTYGPDCKGHANGCNCVKSTGCSRITGDCPFGCIWGWFGDSCNTQGGYIETAPYIISTGYEDIQVGWNPWVKGRDKGDVEPDCYWLEFKKFTDPDSAYRNSTTFCFSTGPSKFSNDVTGLESYTTYAFRVRTVVSGEITPIPSDTVVGTPMCETPIGAPQNLAATAGIRSIQLTWDWPDQKYWRCNEVTIHCDYSCLYRCDASTTPVMSFEVSSTAKTTQKTVTDLPPYATCDFKCYLTLGCGRNGPVAELYNIRNADGPPTKVLDLETFSDSSGLLITWEIPFGEENHVTLYKMIITDRTGMRVNTELEGYKYIFKEAQSGELYTVTVSAFSQLYGLGEASTVFARYFRPTTLADAENESRLARSLVQKGEHTSENEKLVNAITQILVNGGNVDFNCVKINSNNNDMEADKLEASDSDDCKDIQSNTYGISMIVLACLCALFLMAFLIVTWMYFKAAGRGKMLVQDDTSSS